MLSRPAPEGDLGALRVEVAGSQGLTRDARVVGAIDRPAVAAGAVAALAARWVADGRLSRPGAAGLASLVEPGPFLAGSPNGASKWPSSKAPPRKRPNPGWRRAPAHRTRRDSRRSARTFPPVWHAGQYVTS